MPLTAKYLETSNCLYARATNTHLLRRSSNCSQIRLEPGKLGHTQDVGLSRCSIGDQPRLATSRFSMKRTRKEDSEFGEKPLIIPGSPRAAGRNAVVLRKRRRIV